MDFTLAEFLLMSWVYLEAVKLEQMVLPLSPNHVSLHLTLSEMNLHSVTIWQPTNGLLQHLVQKRWMSVLKTTSNGKRL